MCLAGLTLATSLSAMAEAYKPTWESLDSRPTPAWFNESRFGIFIHWGVYAVPAWSPKGQYSEWYWHWMNQKDHAVRKFHNETYGEKFQYQDFAPMFKAELFNPAEWADVFKRSGAKYIVLTSKHHDGFCLWPSREAWNWNAMDVGPHRDLAGDLTKAVDAAGLKMGFYYSLYEWYNPLYLTDRPAYVQTHMIPQLKDLVTRYKPWLVWTDGEWDHPSPEWRSTEFLSWLFNESAIKDTVAVNDRWGKECRGAHGGFYCTEYGNEEHMAKMGNHPWEECRGIGASFGYNRIETPAEYATPEKLIGLLVETSSRGGNLLLDIGPTADGRIPVIMQERLLQIGEWLKVNGEAIYGTKAWRVRKDGTDKAPVRYTAKDGSVYAICLGWPGPELALKGVTAGEGTQVTMLGREGQIDYAATTNGLTIKVPPLSVAEIPCQWAWTFKITAAK